MNFNAIKDPRMSCGKMHFYALNSLNLTYFATTKSDFFMKKIKLRKKEEEKNSLAFPLALIFKIFITVKKNSTMFLTLHKKRNFTKKTYITGVKYALLTMNLKNTA